MNQSFRLNEQFEFADELDRPYTVMAIGERWAVLTRKLTDEDREELEYDGPPCSVYSIVDSETMTRGPHNMAISGYEFETPEGCNEVLKDLESGKIRLSERPGRVVDVILSARGGLDD